MPWCSRRKGHSTRTSRPPWSSPPGSDGSVRLGVRSGSCTLRRICKTPGRQTGKLRQYYGDALDWMREQGYQVKLAAIHLDETTVHAHIDTVPLTQDGRLSRKEVYTRAALNGIHTDLAAHLAARGWDIQRAKAPKKSRYAL